MVGAMKAFQAIKGIIPDSSSHLMMALAGHASKAFSESIFGDIDLTTEGLHKAIQKNVVDGFAALTNVTKRRC